MSAHFAKATYCSNCAVVMVHHSEKYCVGCAEEMLAWLYDAEQVEADRQDEREYLAQIEEKQINFYYED